jgi:hypothetical protein
MRRALLAVLALAMALAPAALGAADLSDLQPQVSKAVRHDVSPPFTELALRPLKSAAAKPDRAIPIKVPLDLAQRHHPKPDADDPVVGTPVPDATPLLTLDFEGLSDDDNATVLGGRVVPPDTNGDVGPSHFVQTVNLIFAVYNKTGGTPVFGPVAINSLWDGFGGDCEAFNDGDPTVVYDNAADRWVISQFAVSGPSGHQCVAVSTSGDPTDSYFRYDFVVSPGRFNDYPKMGVWPDAYYITANEFSSSFEGVIAVAFERSRMLSGLSAQMVKFLVPCGTECYFSMQPSHYDGGTAPPAGSPNTFIQAWDDETWGTGTLPDGYRLFDFSVNWTSPLSSTFTPLPQADAPEFDANLCNFNSACIPQPAPGEKLDVLGQFTMYRAMYRNFGTHESLVINHTVDVNRNLAGVRWAELRDTGGGWFVYQTGTISPDKNHRWMGSIAMDKQGNIAVGYSVSGRKLNPSIRYATRSSTDPLGTMGAEVTLQAGGGVQQSSFNRWGDYSSMSVDPSDGCTFWYTNEYYANNGSFDFKTKIGSFKLPGCI